MVTEKTTGEFAGRDDGKSKLDRELQVAFREARESAKTNPEFHKSYITLLAGLDWEPQSATTKWIEETKAHLAIVWAKLLTREMELAIAESEQRRDELKKVLADPKLMEREAEAEMDRLLGKSAGATEKRDEGIAPERLALRIALGLTRLSLDVVCDYEEGRRSGDFPGRWDALPPHQAQLLRLIDNKLKESRRLDTQGGNEQDSPDRQHAVAGCKP